MMRGIGLLVVILVGCNDCGFEERLNRGEGCSLNSDCAAPLVCRLERCRIECATTADCAIPLACVQDQSGLGACQLADERDCLLDSECPGVLVCRQRQCVNECEADRDCLAGARCVDSPEGKACIDQSNRACVFDSECLGNGFGPDQFCLDGRCREQCFEDRDCGGTWQCRQEINTCCDPDLPAAEPLSCRAPLPVFMTPDAGDGGTDGSADGGDGAIDGGDAGTLACSGSPLTGVVEVSVGGNTGCARVGTGAAARVYCWGGYGNIGLPAGTPATLCPVSVPALEGRDIVDLSIGGGTGCAVLGTGEVYCWGNNGLGEVGLGTESSGEPPTLVPGVTATGIASSFGNTCAWGGADSFCWGTDLWCDLGRTSRVCSTANNSRHRAFPPAPVTVVPQPGPIAVGAAMCGIVAGRVECWGNGTRQMLAMAGGTVIDDAIDISSGEYHACALRSGDGSVHCWGSNFYGGLGDGTTDDRAQIGPVLGLPSRAIDIDGEGRHSCAVLDTGAVYCWGDGTMGGVDPSLDMFPITTPRMIIASGATSVETGFFMNCAQVGDQVRCWGRNGAGQLGNGVDTPQSTVVTVLAP